MSTEIPAENIAPEVAQHKSEETKEDASLAS
jgi:hypothetical protein